MRTLINPREIFFLEKYSSIEYFGEMREIWERMLVHAESCLDSFMKNIPHNYRKRALYDQPDIVWGHRVLPNFRNTLQGLNEGFILLAHGDIEGLGYANGPLNDYKGQLDYPADWMSNPDRNLFDSLVRKASSMAHKIVLTDEAFWHPPTLATYDDKDVPVEFPSHWPTYRINKGILVRSGEKTRVSGIYLPDVENSCAEFLSTNRNAAPPAYVLVGFKDLLHPETGEKYDEEPIHEKKECVWHLVERASDPDIHSVPSSHDKQVFLRVPSGKSCPETGFYFTPAASDSRKLFRKGEVMPDFDTGYGATIWQWDATQD